MREAMGTTMDADLVAHKMQALGHLTTSIAHDLMNFLNVVQASIYLMERKQNDLDPVKMLELLYPLKSATEHSAGLIQQLLNFTRETPIESELLDINCHVRHLKEFFRYTVGPAVAVHMALDRRLWPCYGNTNQLRSALLNLTANARDAMPNGGRLTIRTRNVELDAKPAAAHENMAAGQYVMVAVSDTGLGMSSETRAHAFDLFFTTKEAGKGTGLGLSQVKGFAREVGGGVNICSEVGKGTTVKLYLPRYTTITEAPKGTLKATSCSSADHDAIMGS